jgi:E3 ubiquitin-protein ligase UBR4
MIQFLNICIKNTQKYCYINRQQGFGVLSVALASHALNLMSALLEDVSVETNSDLIVSVPEPAPLDILSTSTALQRAATFLQAVPLNHLLFYLATISYRKVLCMSFITYRLVH